MKEKKVYICPTCGREFESDKGVSKHFLLCWKKMNPHHKSKPAPRSKDINTTENKEELTSFLETFNEES